MRIRGPLPSDFVRAILSTPSDRSADGSHRTGPHLGIATIPDPAPSVNPLSSADSADRLYARRSLVASEKELGGVVFERLRESETFARIKSKGDAALFGGWTTRDMKKRMGVPEPRALEPTPSMPEPRTEWRSEPKPEELPSYAPSASPKPDLVQIETQNDPSGEKSS